MVEGVVEAVVDGVVEAVVDQVVIGVVQVVEGVVQLEPLLVVQVG